MTLVIIKCNTTQSEISAWYIMETFTVEYCTNGEKFDFVKEECVACGLGYYQPTEGDTRDVCFPCDVGFTTLEEETTTSKLDGSDVCKGK